MTEYEALLIAESGAARFTIDRYLTELGRGEDPFWRIEVIGTKAVPTYVAHGNINVDREAVVRSVLTKRGQQRLAEIREAA